MSSYKSRPLSEEIHGLLLEGRRAAARELQHLGLDANHLEHLLKPGH